MYILAHSFRKSKELRIRLTGFFETRKAGPKGAEPMPHVPEELKERLKREVSIQRLAEARGIKLTRKGKSLMGLCPFHDDHSPSLSIDPVENIWNCLGACGRGGDVIEWVMVAEGVSFTHAVELLRRDHLPAVVSSGPPPKQCTVPKLPPLIEHTADDHKLLEIVVSYYHETLKQTPEALRYLESRGLKSSEMIGHFRLGFANRTLGYHLPQANRAAGAAQRGRLQELGILRESGHEHFRGSLVIPIFNRDGEVMQMYGRKITPKEPVLRENLLQLKLKLKRRAVPASIRAFFSSPLGLLVEAPVLPKSLQ
jgi:DNA primase catalytic core